MYARVLKYSVGFENEKINQLGTKKLFCSQGLEYKSKVFNRNFIKSSSNSSTKPWKQSN